MLATNYASDRHWPAKSHVTTTNLQIKLQYVWTRLQTAWSTRREIHVRTVRSSSHEYCSKTIVVCVCGENIQKIISLKYILVMLVYCPSLYIQKIIGCFCINMVGFLFQIVNANRSRTYANIRLWENMFSNLHWNHWTISIIFGKKKYQTVGRVTERDKVDTTNTYIHDCWLFFLGTGTSRKSGRVLLVLLAQTSLLS